jgi:hypothetical protein
MHIDLRIDMLRVGALEQRRDPAIEIKKGRHGNVTDATRREMTWRYNIVHLQ